MAPYDNMVLSKLSMMKISLDFAYPRLPKIFWVFSTFLLMGLLCWQMPANWLTSLFSSQSGCRVIVQQTLGTVWQGSAALGFSELNEQGACREPFAVTERFSWSSSCSLSHLRCQSRIQFSALDQPLMITWSPTKIEVLANQITLPANVLEALGNPWSTLRPRGQLLARWTDLHFGGADLSSVQNTQSGTIRIIINNLGSSISPVKPLGDYEILANLDNDGLAWSLSTSSGPLLLKGNGDTKAGFHFIGQAGATAEAQDSLIGLLGLLGKKEGEAYRIQF